MRPLDPVVEDGQAFAVWACDSAGGPATPPGRSGCERTREYVPTLAPTSPVTDGASDALWVALLEREPGLQSATPDEVREELRTHLFPEELAERCVAALLARRTPPVE